MWNIFYYFFANDFHRENEQKRIWEIRNALMHIGISLVAIWKIKPEINMPRKIADTRKFHVSYNICNIFSTKKKLLMIKICVRKKYIKIFPDFPRKVSRVINFRKKYHLCKNVREKPHAFCFIFVVWYFLRCFCHCYFSKIFFRIRKVCNVWTKLKEFELHGLIQLTNWCEALILLIHA